MRNALASILATCLIWMAKHSDIFAFYLAVFVVLFASKEELNKYTEEQNDNQKI